MNIDVCKRCLERELHHQCDLSIHSSLVEYFGDMLMLAVTGVNNDCGVFKKCLMFVTPRHGGVLNTKNECVDDLLGRMSLVDNECEHYLQHFVFDCNNDKIKELADNCVI